MEFKQFLIDITEEEYRKLDMPSYSSLSRLASDDLSIFDQKDDKFKKGLSLGSVVDKMMFEENFDIYTEYNIIQSIPDLSNGNAINTLIHFIQENSINTESLEELNNISKNLNLWKNIKDDSLRIDRINISEFWESIEYFKLKQNGKPFLLQEDLMLATVMCKTLRNSSLTKDFFNNTNEELEVIYQGKIIFKYDDYEVKSMLDLIIVDHKRKIIFPRDLKTGDETTIYPNFYRFHYPQQASIYTRAIQYLVENNQELKDYKIAPFEFIYISRKKPDKVKIYDMHPIYIQMGINGWQSANGNICKSLHSLVKNWYWHKEHNIYDRTREEAITGRTRIGTPFNSKGLADRLEELYQKEVAKRRERISKKETENITTYDEVILTSSDVDFEETPREKDDNYTWISKEVPYDTNSIQYYDSNDDTNEKPKPFPF